MLLVRDLMTRELATLGPEASAAEALNICRDRSVRHIPIQEDGRLVGLVSDRDLGRASPPEGEENREDTLREMKVGDIMARDVITAHPQDPVGYAAKEMYERKINALPVVVEEDGTEELLGIVTSTDVLRALVMLTGVHESGSQVQVEAPDRPGVLAEVVEVIHDLDVDILSALSSPQKRGSSRTMIFRLTAEDPSTVVQSLQMAGYSVNWIDIPDRPN
ncbi:MAG: CBS and ACT domain-containing protein [Actinomycetota bacterium]|nr:CBS and ACT domain-containing protein [Actinomycetota bacterium]